MLHNLSNAWRIVARSRFLRLLFFLRRVIRNKSHWVGWLLSSVLATWWIIARARHFQLSVWVACRRSEAVAWCTLLNASWGFLLVCSRSWRQRITPESSAHITAELCLRSVSLRTRIMCTGSGHIELSLELKVLQLVSHRVWQVIVFLFVDWVAARARSKLSFWLLNYSLYSNGLASLWTITDLNKCINTTMKVQWTINRIRITLFLASYEPAPGTSSLVFSYCAFDAILSKYHMLKKI